jgi:repressor of nif and glnA expression
MARAYTLTGEAAKQKFGVQAALITSAMSETEPLTTSQITAKIKDRLITRQDPERVVAFYMTTWKKKGIVQLHEVTEQVVTTTASVEPEPAGQDSHVDSDNPPIEEAPEPQPGTEPPPAGDQPLESTPLTGAEAPVSLPDLSGMKLSTAVEEVIKFKGAPLDASGITAILNSHGYEFKENQVNSALQNLVKRGAVAKDDSGLYARS